MTDLLEVVLENVSCSNVCQLFLVLLGHAGQIIKVQSNEPIEISSEADISQDEIESFINLTNDASLIIKLRDLNLAGIIIPSVLLRLVKYGDQYDIDFNFDESDISDVGTTELMKELNVYISDLGKTYQVGEWFGGMEPASDEDTRYFTNTEDGPLS